MKFLLDILAEFIPVIIVLSVLIIPLGLEPVTRWQAFFIALKQALQALQAILYIYPYKHIKTL